MAVLRAPVLLLFLLAAACGLGVSGTVIGTDAGGFVDAGDAAPMGPGGPAPIEGQDASPADAADDAAGASPITHVGTTTGRSSGSSAVTATDVLSGGDFYLAAVATKPHVRVANVSGGPSGWQLVAFQCGEDNQTGVEVWFAKKTIAATTPSVTVTLSNLTSNAVVAVSVYTGARGIGGVVSANSNGLRGSCLDDGEGTAAFSLTVMAQPGGLTYGAVAMRNRTLTPGPDNVEIAKVRAGEGGDAAALAVLGTTTKNALSGTFNGATGWALIGAELLP